MHRVRRWERLWWVLVQSAFFMLADYQYLLAEVFFPGPSAVQEHQPLRKRINFVATKGQHRTPSRPGWEEYDGSVYTKERGYGWLTDLSGRGRDGGGLGKMILPDGARASPRDLGRLELASWQGTHQENHPLVFRVDLPDGWYRVICTSVDPDNAPLPLVDQRSIKFRAHDVIFAGPPYGEPLKIEGNRLVEGSGIVEVTEGHLRIVAGDPAYGGWTWSYKGPFWRGWRRWWSRHSWHASNWYEKLTRKVDPGFHSLRFNSLEIERVPAPAKQSSLVFRDFFNREDSPDINSGISEANRWSKLKLQPEIPDDIETELYRTSLKLARLKNGKSSIGVVQNKISPKTGIIRYSTRVSLFTGEGSRIHSGAQEGGLLILGEPTGTTEFSSTFIGVAFDRTRPGTPGWVRYRVGNGRNGYRTDSEIPDTTLPFQVTEGEYEIVADHDVRHNILSRIQINGVDITGYVASSDRKQRIPRGPFGVRAFMDPLRSGVRLQQFYWYYRVEDISRRDKF